MSWKHLPMFKLDFLKMEELSWPKFVESQFEGNLMNCHQFWTAGMSYGGLCSK